MADTRPGPLTILAKLPARLRARGAKEIGTLALRRVKEAVNSSDRLVFFLRTTAGAGGSGGSPGLSFHRAGAQDATAYERDIGTDSKETFSRRLSRGTRCYLVSEDDKILHASWVTTTASWVREIGRYFTPLAGHAYVYESFTRADARGRGVYPFALREICEELAGEDIARLWVAVEADNPPSLRAVAKAGFEKAFELDYRRRLGRLSLDDPRGPKADMGARCLARKLSD